MDEIGYTLEILVWSVGTVDAAEKIQVVSLIMIDVWLLEVSGATYIGWVKFKERLIGSFGTNIGQLNGFLQLNRVNSKKYVFLVNIMKINDDIIDTIMDVICFDDITCRLYIFLYGRQNVVDSKNNFYKGIIVPLNILFR